MTYKNGAPSSDSVNLGSNPSSPATGNADVSGVSRDLSTADNLVTAEQMRTTDRTKPGTAKIIAAQWQIRAIAKGKPKHVRDAAWTAIWNLTRIGRGRGTPEVLRVIAEKIEILKGRA